MAKPAVLILGGGGMLGSDIAAACRNSGIEVRVLDLPKFDITDAQQVEQAVGGSEIIINCAAYTNVDKAESEFELANKVNAEAAGRLGRIAKAAGAWVLHISTDFVFDGKSDRPYVETDATNPLSAYGRTKLAGEKLLLQSQCNCCIIRVEWTYGKNGNNFVKKLIETAKSGKSLKVVDDQIGSPTATAEVAGAICQLLVPMPEGIFHFAAAGYVSRYEMAEFIFDKLSMPVELSSCKSSDYDSPADRPANSRFDCSKIQRLLDEPIKPWQGPLEDFLERL